MKLTQVCSVEIVKPLLSRNFRKRSLGVNFCNFHTVQYYHFVIYSLGVKEGRSQDEKKIGTVSRKFPSNRSQVIPLHTVEIRTIYSIGKNNFPKIS